GGFYDDLGNPARPSRLVRPVPYAKDPGNFHSPRIGFTPPHPNHRISWCKHAESLFDAPLQIRYAGLDPQAKYKVRVVYGGDSFRTRMRLVANEATEVHPFIPKDRDLKPVEFDIPPEATRTGTLLLNWTK